MKYYEEMRNKYGFDDGGAQPAGVELYREAYILAINAIAEGMNSKVRAMAYDRPGMHNSCMIYFVDATRTPALSAEQLATGIEDHWDCAEPDTAMDEAIAAAFDVGVDTYVKTRVTFPQGNRAALIEAAKEAAPEKV